MSKKIIGSMIFAAVAASGTVNAAISTETTINFNTMTAGTSGFANNGPIPLDALIAPGNCGTGVSACYSQNGMIVGIVQDTSELGAGSHIHKENGIGTDKFVGYESDSSGIYIRALDSTAFKLTSLDFRAPISAANPIYGANPTVELGTIQPDGSGVLGANEYWEILGYKDAKNEGLDTATNSGSWIARQTVTNGFDSTVDGTLALSSAFNNISAFWIHYNGYQQYPGNGISFAMELDNVKVNAAVSAVPVPAAVWMFLSGMMGLLAFSKKKAGLVA